LSNFDEYLRRSDPHLADTDGDGLDDGEEVLVHDTDPLWADSDRDGLTDFDEVNAHGTDPTYEDSDEDGISDGVEVSELGTNPLDVDSDGDGFSDSEEVRLGVNPTDGSSRPAPFRQFFESFEASELPREFLPGSADTYGWELTAEGTAAHGRKVASAPWMKGNSRAEFVWRGEFEESVLSYFVFQHGAVCCATFELIVDGSVVHRVDAGTDWARLATSISAGSHELVWRITNPPYEREYDWQLFLDAIVLAPLDADNDGMPGDWEFLHGFDPDDPADAASDADSDNVSNLDEYNAGTDPNDPDSDNDSLPDGWELQYGLDPLDGSDRNGDPDGDSISNPEEYEFGTSPIDADTDADGMRDDWEMRYGLDPLVDDAGQDADGDGSTNLAEYEASTDPTDAASRPSGGGSSGGGSGGGSSGGGGGSSSGGGSPSPAGLILLALLALVRERRVKILAKVRLSSHSRAIPGHP
jgi:uncharacterized membrane protein YgcG